MPIVCTGNDFSTLYAPLIRDGRMEKVRGLGAGWVAPAVGGLGMPHKHTCLFGGIRRGCAGVGLPCMRLTGCPTPCPLLWRSTTGTQPVRTASACAWASSR